MPNILLAFGVLLCDRVATFSQIVLLVYDVIPSNLFSYKMHVALRISIQSEPLHSQCVLKMIVHNFLFAVRMQKEKK